jgi:hypothetical protein
MTDLDKLKEIQPNGELLYYDEKLDHALMRRGIEILQRDNNNLVNILIQFKGDYYISEQAFRLLSDDEYWTEWKQVGVIVKFIYELYDLT